MENNSAELRVMFFLHRIGPYHHARFNSLATRINLVAVETRPESTEYPWEFSDSGNYTKLSLGQKKKRGSALREEMLDLLHVYTPHVIITTGWADYEYHAAVLAAKARHIPCIVVSDSRYEDEIRCFYKEWIKKVILKSYSAALVAGAMSTNYLLYLGFSAERIFKPWDVVDNSHFSGVLSDAPYRERSFLCVSRFIEKKNLARLIIAYSSYLENGGTRKLALLGSGEDESVLKDLVTTKGIQSHVEFNGFVQYDRLPGFLKSSLCLILPSTTDQWGLVVNEAMAAGLPVLVSNRCGCATDLVQSGKNGYTFDPFDVQDLLAKMHTIDELTSDDWRTMGEASKEIISSWSLDSFAEVTEKACLHAVDHPVLSKFAIIHMILSR